VNAALRNLGQTLGVAIFVAVASRTTAGELLAHHRLGWWLVAAAGVAVSATSWWLPRAGAATRAVAVEAREGVFVGTHSLAAPISGHQPMRIEEFVAKNRAAFVTGGTHPCRSSS
jgi:hypothetical protein